MKPLQTWGVMTEMARDSAITFRHVTAAVVGEGTPREKLFSLDDAGIAAALNYERFVVREVYYTACPGHGVANSETFSWNNSFFVPPQIRRHEVGDEDHYRFRECNACGYVELKPGYRRTRAQPRPQLQRAPA